MICIRLVLLGPAKPLASAVCSPEIKELRVRLQFSLQNESSFVLDQVSDFTIRIEQISEFASAYRAGFMASRVFPLPNPRSTVTKSMHMMMAATESSSPNRTTSRIGPQLYT